MWVVCCVFLYRIIKMWIMLSRAFSQVLWTSCKVWIRAGRSFWRHALWVASVAALAVLAAPVEEPRWVTAWPTIQTYFLSSHISWSKMKAAPPTLQSPLLSLSGILMEANSQWKERVSSLLKELYGLFKRLFEPVKASWFCDIPALCH